MSAAEMIRERILRYLSKLLREDSVISEIFLRHSSAYAPQNPLLSDFDVTVFVRTTHLEDFREAVRKIRHKMRFSIPGRLCLGDAMFLPDTALIRNWLENSYYFRSIYPFKCWLSVRTGRQSSEAEISHTLPFDLAPERVLLSYLIPVLRNRKRRRLFETEFLDRKLEMDCRIAGVSNSAGTAGGFWPCLAEEISLWNDFYTGFPPQNSSFELDEIILFPVPNYTPFEWARSRITESSLLRENIESIWLFPSGMNSFEPYMTVNVRDGIDPESLRQSIKLLLEIFKGLFFTLQIGTRTSMFGRIQGLSDFFLFEPWLFSRYSICLFGDVGSTGVVSLPAQDMVDAKFIQLVLYFLGIWSGEGELPYQLFQSIFLMRDLHDNSRLIHDSTALKNIFRQDMLLRSEYQSESLPSRQRLFFSALEKYHGVQVFS